MKPTVILLAVIFLAFAACSTTNRRGIADKRSNFEKFLPMTSDPTTEGLKVVRPFFKTAKRAEILRAIERACSGVGEDGQPKRGSSVFRPELHDGYYVNCNPENRQLLNGYVPANPRRAPHSRPPE